MTTVNTICQIECKSSFLMEKNERNNLHFKIEALLNDNN